MKFVLFLADLLWIGREIGPNSRMIFFYAWPKDRRVRYWASEIEHVMITREQEPQHLWYSIRIFLKGGDKADYEVSEPTFLELQNSPLKFVHSPRLVSPASKKTMPSDEDQIRALINNEAHALVMATLRKKQLEPGDYDRVINVSFDTVVNYLLANCSITDIADTRESQRDGYYALPSGSSWVVYYQERATDSGRDIMYSEKDVFSHFTKTILHIRPDREA